MKTKLQKIYDTISPAIDRKIEAVIAKYEMTEESKVRTLDEILAPNHARFIEYGDISRRLQANAQQTWSESRMIAASGYHPAQAMSTDQIAEYNTMQVRGAAMSGRGLFGGSFI